MFCCWYRLTCHQHLKSTVKYLNVLLYRALVNCVNISLVLTCENK